MFVLIAIASYCVNSHSTLVIYAESSLFYKVHDILCLSNRNNIKNVLCIIGFIAYDVPPNVRVNCLRINPNKYVQYYHRSNRDFDATIKKMSSNWQIVPFPLLNLHPIEIAPHFVPLVGINKSNSANFL